MQVGGAAARKIALLEHLHKGHHADDHPPEQPGGLAGIRLSSASGNGSHKGDVVSEGKSVCFS